MPGYPKILIFNNKIFTIYDMVVLLLPKVFLTTGKVSCLLLADQMPMRTLTLTFLHPTLIFS